MPEGHHFSKIKSHHYSSAWLKLEKQLAKNDKSITVESVLEKAKRYFNRDDYPNRKKGRRLLLDALNEAVTNEPKQIPKVMSYIQTYFITRCKKTGYCFNDTDGNTDVILRHFSRDMEKILNNAGYTWPPESQQDKTLQKSTGVKSWVKRKLPGCGNTEEYKYHRQKK